MRAHILDRLELTSARGQSERSRRLCESLTYEIINILTSNLFIISSSNDYEENKHRKQS